MSTGSIFSKDIPFSKDLPASVTHCVAVRSRVILQDEHVLGRQWQLRVIEDWRKCMDYETEYEGYGCQVVQQYELTEKPLHTENAVFLHILSEHLHYSGSRS